MKLFLQLYVIELVSEKDTDKKMSINPFYSVNICYGK